MAAEPRQTEREGSLEEKKHGEIRQGRDGQADSMNPAFLKPAARELASMKPACRKLASMKPARCRRFSEERAKEKRLYQDGPRGQDRRQKEKAECERAAFTQ